MSRTLNTIKNTTFGVMAQFITLIINFLNRTIFIHFLGVEYLGLSGLFSNILSMLSLAELGIGVAISFSLYKPLAQNNIRKTKALMHFYSKAYRLIGITILILGLCLIPFLDYLIQDRPDIPHFVLIYIMFLGNSVVSYFFTYKRSLLSADQKEYLNTINRTIFMIIQSIAQFFVLLIFKNYVFYLLTVIICTIMSNIWISIKCDKIYPFLKDNQEKLTKKETRDLLKYVGAQMSHKVGGIVVNGTDNILTTAFVKNGLVVVGLYSNYLLIINAIKSIINMFFASAMASVGNLNAADEPKKSKNVFNRMFFLNMCFFGISASCIFNLSSDFIKVWLGEDYLISQQIVFIIGLNYFVTGMRQSCITFNTTLGLFWNDRFKPWIEAFINLVISILFIKQFGFAGVLMGTLVSTLATSFWVEPYILYKHGFKMPVVDYFYRYLQYALATVIITAISYVVTMPLDVESFWMWLVKAIITFGVSVIFVFWGFKNKEEVLELKKVVSIIFEKIQKFRK